jgi:hypothetical protein
MMADARRGEFSVLTVAAFDRIARSTKNFLEIVDELHELGIEFISAREAIDTSGPMGRMFLTMVGSIAELERSLIVERIKAGMRRAKLEGQRLGTTLLDIDRDALVRDRLCGMSLTETAKRYRVSRATVVRLVREVSQQQMVAISNHRLVSFAEGKVTFRWRDSAHHNEQRLLTLSLDEFLRRFLLHVLPKGFVRIRNFGFLANRRRATLLPLGFQLLGALQQPQTEPEASAANESSPLWLCPQCGGPMRVIERLTAAQIQLRSPPAQVAAAA